LAAITRTTLLALQVSSFPPLRLTVESSIPVASGLGSSAAVSVAIARALNQHFGGALTTARISDLAYEVEKIHHGTPSGIDNTVVAHDRPVYFVRGREPEPLAIGASVRFLIGDTGIPAPTSQAVGLVRRRWEADPAALEAVFDAIAGLVTQARQALVDGQSAALGDFMNQNHRHLAGLGVSSPDLDRLVLAAGSTGALGAKMSGGGLGGNMVALVSPDRDEAVADALRRAGAVRVIQTEVTP
jgi:mevalonate kinase